MRRASSLALLLPFALTLSIAGCKSERYFCDDTGCYFCDGLGCRDVNAPPRPSCSGDYDCPAGSLCTEAGCVVGCESVADCPSGTDCRDGMCLDPVEPRPGRTPGTCVLDADCSASGLVCREGMCVPDVEACGEEGCSCVATGLCSAGFVCSAGECRAAEEVCQFNHDCGAGGICIDGRCTSGCSTDASCVEGQECVDRVCRNLPPPTGECRVDPDCADGQTCVDGVCFDSCTTDGNCIEGYYCRDRVCVIDDRPRPFCIGDSDCEPGHPCVGGICRTPCADSMECLRFDVQFNVCRAGYCVTTNEATSDCVTTADCPSGDECIDGICR